MSTPNLQSLLQFTGLKASPFPINSRYRGIDTGTLVTPSGDTIVYLRRRFVPAPENLSLIQQVSLKQGDRLDNIAAQYLSDPELFWRICDANRALRPDDLETPGMTLDIALPEGVAGIA
jgi:hypothetical protein